MNESINAMREAEPAQEPAEQMDMVEAERIYDQNRARMGKIIDTIPPDALEFLVFIVEDWARREGYLDE